jgi:Protein of unknown function (DUF3618)
MDEPTIASQVAATRAQLENTLDAIEDKLNVPKQVSLLAQRTRASYGANPIPWIIGATAAAIVVAGLVAWAVLSDDD